ncbi:unnamed protein product [Adineta ricciae]|uniref:Carrier domain-containing protein n=1 Tax=Adineta ricciae TaxID=249248 RepID=A0A815G3J1_ADIRI|nr:unnamed protein product [Adineta ricciae]
MTENNRFWINILRDYDSERIFPLPYDRHPIPNEKRSDQIWSSTFEFDSEMLQIIHQHAEELNTTIENLLFSSYYIFLFKLTNGEMDLYVGRNISIDHRIPFYLRIGPTWSFAQLLKQVTQMSACTKQHAHLPLSSIHSLKHPLKFPVVFYYGRQLLQQSPSDLSLCIVHDEQLNTLRYQVHASAHVFDQSTTQQLSQRFQCLFHQLFTSFDLNIQPIYQLSIILPHEHALLKHFHPLQTHSQKPTSTTIPHLFIQQAIKNPHKTAVTLDHSSLTYSQLLSQANQLAHTLIDDHHISEGDIVCQCMHRSIDMVIGILAIMMAGAIYVPLNPSDSSHRLDSLIQQIKPKLVLRRLPHTGHPYEQSPQLSITGESIAHIIFTSGSTGSPKGVQIRHRNFVSYMETHQFDDKDIILQLANCSFDVHVDEIVSALCRGAHLVLLRHGGHLDFDYLTSVIAERQVTFIAPVPSWIDGLCGYLRENSHACDRMRSIRWWFIGGEQLLSSTIRQLLPFIDEECHLLNTYGPAEITETATCYEVNRDEVSEMISIPIGRPLSGYRVFVVDEYGQEVVPGEQGEIVVGGVGVFGGYYGREELSKEVMMEVEGDLCYKTGDYGRMEVKSGELKFVGRKDFQIKLRGQRIELGHIEHTILRFSSFISNCIVMKAMYHEQEHLVAYVETTVTAVNEDSLRENCSLTLASYMVPSLFIILQKFPLSLNGKVDRKSLPSPDFALLTQLVDADAEAMNPMEVRVHRLWCKVFYLPKIPANSSFFSLHGTSLLFMKLYNLYQTEFGIAPDIVTCLQQPHINEHARLLTDLISSTLNPRYEPWSSLHVDQGAVSFAQSRIYLDEQIRFQSSNKTTTAIYNLPLLCRLSQSFISIIRLRETLQEITEKHDVLRTSIQFDSATGHLKQSVLPTSLQDCFTFKMSIIDDADELKTIFNDELTNRNYFDIERGRVFRCHIIRQRSTMCNDADLLSIGDWIIFNFHHIAFDGESEQIFLDDFHQLYSRQQHKQELLQYIDLDENEYIPY